MSAMKQLIEASGLSFASQRPLARRAARPAVVEGLERRDLFSVSLATAVDGYPVCGTKPPGSHPPKLTVAPSVKASAVATGTRTGSVVAADEDGRPYCGNGFIHWPPGHGPVGGSIVTSNPVAIGASTFSNVGVAR